MQFLQMLVFARWAGPAAAGDYALAATFMGFLAPLAEAGMSQAVVQARSLRSEQMATLAWVGFALGAAILGLLFLGAPAVSRWYERPDLAGLLPLLGLTLLITPFGAQQGGLLVRDFRFDLAARIEVGAALTGFALLVVLLMMGWGVWAMALSFVLRNSMAALACLWVARRHYPVNWFKTSALRDVWPLIRFGSLDLSARWADFLANYLDKLIVGKWLGATALGYYNLAFSLSVLPTARIGYVVTRVLYPVFAKMRNDPSALQFYYQRAGQELSLLLFPVYIGLGLFSRELILLLYGAAWLPAAPLLIAFSVAGLIRSLNAVSPQLTKGIGKPQLSTLWMLLWAFALGVFLLGFLWISPELSSAAWSRVAAKCTVELSLLFVLAKWCGVRFGPVLHYALRVLLALLPVVVTVCLIDVYIVDFSLKIALKAAFFVAGLFWFGTRPRWKNDLKTVRDSFFRQKNLP